MVRLRHEEQVERVGTQPPPSHHNTIRVEEVEVAAPLGRSVIVREVQDIGDVPALRLVAVGSQQQEVAGREQRRLRVGLDQPIDASDPP